MQIIYVKMELSYVMKMNVKQIFLKHLFLLGQ